MTTCTNCGREYEGDRCYHCGRPSVRSANRTVAITLLVLAVIPAAIFGACSLVIAASSLTGPPNKEQAFYSQVFLAAGVLSLIAGGFALRAVIKLWNRE